MEISIPDQLAALAHAKRLDLFRLLIRHYPSAMAAGQIARDMGLKPNTTSSYLATLRQAGLIRQNRVATSLQYSADMNNIRALLGGLMSDCCQNRPDLCLPRDGDIPQRAVLGDPGKVLNVLFLCTGNSARSIIAEAILQDRGAGRFAGHSAGTRPKSAAHPDVLHFLQVKGHDISGLTPKSLDRFETPSAPHMDLVITLCDAAASEECPIWPGQPISAHWGQPDPVGSGRGTKDIEDAYDLLGARIDALTALDLSALTPIDMQHAVDDIGRMPTNPGKGT